MAAERDGQPYLVNTTDEGIECVGLRPIPLEKKVLEETWLQNLLDRYPDILPISSIDERVTPPLFSLGREISTPSGPIDNLFLSQDGYLVVVETKLWRNPEARRQVVAQILDYAGQLRRWRYSDIDEIWRKRNGSNGSMWEDLKPEGFDEHSWIDRINFNLSEGRMTLLIVGDGIRSEARTLAEAIAGHPDFQFRLGLIELRLFELDDGRVLVFPTPSLKTQEVERVVVQISYSQETPPAVKVELPQAGDRGPSQRSILSEEALRTDLLALGAPQGPIAARVVENLLSQLDATDLTIEWGSGGFSIKMPEPTGSGTMLSLGVVTREGIFYSWFPWLQK